MGAALALALAAPAAAQQGTLEGPLKATFLHRFADFVQWPPAVFAALEEPLHICVVGVDRFGEVLDHAIAGRQVDGRPLAARRLPRLEPGSGCHIAYISGSPAQPVAEALAAVDGAPVLTVTDAAAGEARGMVHFEVVEDRVRFHIDEEAAARARLTVSSRLLGVALTVRRRPQ